jgi:hypothetical protein
MSALRAESPLHVGDWPAFFDPVNPAAPAILSRAPAGTALFGKRIEA